MRPLTLAILPALALSACTFVGQTHYQNALCRLDEDGDGDPRCGISNSTADGDCDDSNPLVFNGNVEIPYDGLDNDCRDGDLLDVDGDGYPGISREDYEALPVHEPWPQGLPEELDCEDLPIPGFPRGYEANVYPGAPEIWYDGIDGDCSGNDDFDQDFDGFAAAEYAHVYEGDLPPTDCLDTDADVFPGSEVPNEPYTGIDQDCSGQNDFDPDGDGRLTPGYNADAATYAARYGYDLTWIPDADCMDIGDLFPEGEADPDLAARTYRRVIGADCASDAVSCEETWYDGYDDACDDIAAGRVIRTDFDQDGDGYLRRTSDPEADRAAFLAYVNRYLAFTNSRGEQPYRAAFEQTFGTTEEEMLAWYEARSNDCDDTDPTINPSAIERLGDGVDRDCDGDPDNTSFSFGDIEWDGPGPVRATETSEHVVLIASAIGGVDFQDGLGQRSVRSVSLSWGAESTSAEDYAVNEAPFTVALPTATLDPFVSPYAIGDGYLVGHSWFVDRHRLVLSRSVRDRIGSSSYRVRSQADSGTRSGDPESYLGIDVRCDPVSGEGLDECWIVACDETSLQWMTVQTTATGTTNQGTSFDRFDDLAEPEFFPTSCSVLPSSLAPEGFAMGILGDDGSFFVLEDDGDGELRVATEHPFPSGSDTTFVRSHQDWLLLGRDQAGLTLWGASGGSLDLLTDLDLIDADAVVIESGSELRVYVVGLTRAGELIFAYGDPSDLERQSFTIDAEHGPLDIDSVAVARSEQHLLIAARGFDGPTHRIGWAFFEAP